MTPQSGTQLGEREPAKAFHDLAETPGGEDLYRLARRKKLSQADAVQFAMKHRSEAAE